ncbi:hypothetical protein XI03_05075 [Bradyrhizobium sp. CCBAU 65884]|nr:hypothetical protein [Bradyrhizobium sp. CCBAU 65884]
MGIARVVSTASSAGHRRAPPLRASALFVKARRFARTSLLDQLAGEMTEINIALKSAVLDQFM